LKRNFLVFINPVSGTKSKAAIRPLIEKSLAAKNYPYNVLPTEASGKYEFLATKIQDEKITDVIICGGDGTVNQVTYYLQGSKVNAGIIPMGSGNGLAFAAGIPKNPKKALDIILNGKAIAIDAFMINDQFSCMLCGLGFDAQVAHDFAKQSSRGLATYIKQTVKNFFTASTYPFIIRMNSATISTEAFFISIANSNQFGNNFTIAPKASLSDGLLDIVIVNRTGKLNLILKIMQQVRRGKITEDINLKRTVQYFHTKALSISNPGNAPLHIDGEPVNSSKQLEIKIIEKAFRLLQPVG
jgi:YegS/Rv2252/BmrU family lipid kinase